MKRRRLALSAAASADLDDIHQHTAEQFGEDQARRYLAGLRDALDGSVTTQPNTSEVQPKADSRPSAAALAFRQPLSAAVQTSWQVASRSHRSMKPSLRRTSCRAEQEVTIEEPTNSLTSRIPNVSGRAP